MPVEDTNYITQSVICIGVSHEIPMQIRPSGIYQIWMTGMVSYFDTTYYCYLTATPSLWNMQVISHTPVFHKKCSICDTDDKSLTNSGMTN